MQNRRLWTAGSKTKKLRGLSIKTGAVWNYFYTAQDCGFISKESRDSLAKWPVRRGIFRSGPLDRDLRAQDCLDRDLISSVGLRSNGSDLTRRRGGGDLSPASYSAVACGGESPEYAVSGPPRVVSTRACVGRGQRSMREPPGL